MKVIQSKPAGKALRPEPEPMPASRRKPQRLVEFDYATAGAYFVTICVKDHSPILGKIIGEEINLSPAGEIVTQVWSNLSDHYEKIELDEFIVMPNHLHGIIWILGNSPSLESVGEGLRPSPTLPAKQVGLPEIVRALKSFSAREINKKRGSLEPFWQRGYHDHIIRNNEDLNQHRAYIQNNPLKWALDEYYQ